MLRDVCWPWILQLAVAVAFAAVSGGASHTNLLANAKGEQSRPVCSLLFFVHAV